MHCNFRSAFLTSLLLSVLLLSFLLLAGGCVSLKDIQLASGGVEYWWAELDGDVKVSKGNLPGTKIDLTDDIGIDKREEVYVYHAGIQFGPAALDVKYMNLDYDGDSKITQALTFEGVPFEVDANVITDLDITFASAHSKFGLFGGKFFAIGGIVGLDYVSLDSKLFSPDRNPGTGGANAVTVSEKFDEFFPVLGVTVTSSIPLGEYAFFAEVDVSGMRTFEFIRDLDGWFIDASAKAGFKLAEWLAVGGGYRLLAVDIEDDDDNDFAVQLDGVFVFAELRF